MGLAESPDVLVPLEAPSLRLSRSLAHVPEWREPEPALITPDAPPPVRAPAPYTVTSRGHGPRDVSASVAPLPLTVMLGGIALVASIGWLIERRRLRRALDPMPRAGAQSMTSSLFSGYSGLDDTLTDNPTPSETARALLVTAIGTTSSHRKATLIDLHQLQRRLQRRRKRGDLEAVTLLLQQHLMVFRFTSPWVFLELRELYLKLKRQKEWDIARDAFRVRFGQNAPLWTAPSTASAQLLDDRDLCVDLAARWPYREARMWLLLWMLGEDDMRQPTLGPPLLPLGVYRDMMALDNLLDDVMMVRLPPTRSLPPEPAPTPAPASVRTGDANGPGTVAEKDPLSPT